MMLLNDSILVILEIFAVLSLMPSMTVLGEIDVDADLNKTVAVTQKGDDSLLSVEWTNEMNWKDVAKVTVKVKCINQSCASYLVTAASNDTGVITVIGQSSEYIDCVSRKSGNESFTSDTTSMDSLNTTTTSTVSQFTVYAKFLGHSYVNIYLSAADFRSTTSGVFVASSNDTFSSVQSPPPSGQYEVIVVNKETILSRVFIIIIATLMILLNFGFGCRIHVDIVKSILKKPLAPALGLTCQFILMPLLGLGLTKLLPFPVTMGFGLFVTATAPGGGGSNVWTILLDGDLDLSMTMTFFSKTLALFTMPTWIFCLSRLYITDRTIIVPYMQLFIGLLSLAVPCILGMVLKRYKPHVADRISKVIKPLSVLFILWVIIVGSLTNTYIYTLMSSHWYVIIGGCLLPYLGMLLGFIIAKAACQPHTRVIAISLETGIQDTGVPILLLLASFEKPLGSLAATMPMTCGLFTPFPLLMCVLTLAIYKHSCKQTEDQDKESTHKEESDEEGVKVMYCAVETEDVANLDQEQQVNQDIVPKRITGGTGRLVSRNYKTRL